MNICMMVEFSASKYLEGTNRLNLEIAKHLVKQGHNVTIISPLWKPVSEEEKKVWESQGIELELFSVPAIANPVMRLAGYLFKCVSLSFRQKFDVVSGCYTAPPALAAIIAGIILGKRKLATVYEPAACYSIAGIPFGNYLLQKADKVCTLTEQVKKILSEKNFVPAEKIFVIPGFVDFSVFNPKKPAVAIREKYGLEKNLSVLLLGRVSRLKGAPFIIEAIAKAKAPIKVLFAGREVEGENYHELAQKLGVEEKVFFLGYVPDEQVPLLLSAVDVFCLPSLSEGFGIVLAEAMACAKPVIVFDTVPLPEVAGNAGIIVKSEDTVALAKAIDSFYFEKNKLKQLGANALERAKLFEKNFVLQKFEKLFVS